MIKKMPRCVGHYDVGDPICDGEPDGATENDRMACVFRNRCAGFKKLCQTVDKEPKHLVSIRKVEDADGEGRKYAFAKVDDDTFGELCAIQVRRWGIKDGRITRRTPLEDAPPRPKKAKAPKKAVRPIPPPTPDARRKATAAIKDKAAEAHAHAYTMAAWFTKSMEEATGRKIHQSMTEASVGDLVLVDRVDKSKYIALYCKASDKGKKLAVASAYFRTRSKLVHIRVAADTVAFTEVIAAPNRAALGIKEIRNDGHFKSGTGNLDQEGVSLSVEGIARLVRKGIIELPANPR
jgi:hypothetical protein